MDGRILLRSLLTLLLLGLLVFPAPVFSQKPAQEQKDFEALRLQRGRETFHRLFGEEYGEELLKTVEARSPLLGRYLVGMNTGEIWPRTVLDLRTRILCNIAVFTVTQLEEDFKFFVIAALHNGITEEELQEVVLLMAMESGFPRALKASAWIKEGKAKYAEVQRRVKAKKEHGR